ncbi:hypothetical protein N7478_006256 [Penicillium angulare]|uniref:uncharacterized protein n=1 Tax=Penicillium angulare TaxID=116970 RepID=UPI0025412068|nr:uncharacterized protein N7478_006256 [Penicillium angulare]KAJ5280884.1 hypothetical protein N7478_006256 [Penicillium angulare]
MRFITALAGTLFASSSYASTGLIHTLDQEHCVLTFEDFGGWSGTTLPIGKWHWDTNSCSTDDYSMPKYTWPPGDSKYINVFYNFADYHEGGPGYTSIVIGPEPLKIFWTALDPNIVGTVQELPFVKDGFAPGL